MSPGHAHPEVHEPPAHPASMPGGEAMQSAQPAAVSVQMEHMAPTWPHFANRQMWMRVVPVETRDVQAAEESDWESPGWRHS